MDSVFPVFPRRVFLSFFFLAMNVDFSREQCTRAQVHCSRDPQTSLFNNFFIKNESHDTIHTFKNYFTTVFLIFSFQFLTIFKRTLSHVWLVGHKSQWINSGIWQSFLALGQAWACRKTWITSRIQWDLRRERILKVEPFHGAHTEEIQYKWAQCGQQVLLLGHQRC